MGFDIGAWAVLTGSAGFVLVLYLEATLLSYSDRYPEPPKHLTSGTHLNTWSEYPYHLRIPELRVFELRIRLRIQGFDPPSCRGHDINLTELSTLAKI